MSANISHNIFLPTEVLDHIIYSLIPFEDRFSIALPPRHLTTKTLLALTRASRSTHPAAARLLYTRCLYIDSVDRLHRISMTMSKMAGCMPSHFSELLLLKAGAIGRLRALPRSSMYPIISENYIRNPKLPRFDPRRHNTFLYLSPLVKDQKRYSDLDIDAVAHSINDFICLIAHNLQRLVVNIEMKHFSQAIRKLYGPILALSDAFRRCTNVKFLHSEYDYFQLTPHGGGIDDTYTAAWIRWRRLETLVVSHRFRTESFPWRSLVYMPSIQTLILIQPEELDWTTINLGWHKEADYIKRKERNLRVLHIEADPRKFTGPSELKNGCIQVKEILVPELKSTRVWPPPKAIPDHEWCQNWVRLKILSGQDPAHWE